MHSWSLKLALEDHIGSHHIKTMMNLSAVTLVLKRKENKLITCSVPSLSALSPGVEVSRPWAHALF